FAQKYWGHWKVWLWMILSAIITLVLNWQVAVASVSAFLISEAIDWFVYYVMKKDLKWRVIVSNLFSCPMDSLVFVIIAFGWVPEAIFGQAVIKYLSGLLVVPFIPQITKAYDKLGEKFVNHF
ncbi:MAG: VUT family protein, partial [Melioribacteraceae bacterium]|nr:VUT family protein [Melioribacteraceae bacterium]